MNYLVDYSGLTWALYQGESVGQQRNGFGIQIFMNQAVYVGHWEENKADGIGLLLFANGTSFEGHFKKNVLLEGTVTYPNQAQFKGSLDGSADQNFAKGEFAFKNRNVLRGTWRGGKFVNGELATSPGDLSPIPVDMREQQKEQEMANYLIGPVYMFLKGSNGVNICNTKNTLFEGSIDQTYSVFGFGVRYYNTTKYLEMNYEHSTPKGRGREFNLNKGIETKFNSKDGKIVERVNFCWGNGVVAEFQPTLNITLPILNRSRFVFSKGQVNEESLNAGRIRLDNLPLEFEGADGELKCIQLSVGKAKWEPRELEGLDLKFDWIFRNVLNHCRSYREKIVTFVAEFFGDQVYELQDKMDQLASEAPAGRLPGRAVPAAGEPASAPAGPKENFGGVLSGREIILNPLIGSEGNGNLSGSRGSQKGQSRQYQGSESRPGEGQSHGANELTDEKGPGKNSTPYRGTGEKFLDENSNSLDVLLKNGGKDLGRVQGVSKPTIHPAHPKNPEETDPFASIPLPERRHSDVIVINSEQSPVHDVHGDDSRSAKPSAPAHPESRSRPTHHEHHITVPPNSFEREPIFNPAKSSEMLLRESPLTFGKAHHQQTHPTSSDHHGPHGNREHGVRKGSDSDKRISVFQDGHLDNTFFSFLRESSRTYFKGELICEKKNGFCQEKFANGASTEGHFRNDLLEGPATVTTPSNELFRGEFISGRPTGTFTKLTQAGETVKGIFQSGRFLPRTTVVIDNFEVTVFPGDDSGISGDATLTSNDNRFMLHCQFIEGSVPNSSRCRMVDLQTAREKLGTIYVGQKRDCLMIADDSDTYRINPLKKKIKNMMMSVPFSGKSEANSTQE